MKLKREIMADLEIKTLGSSEVELDSLPEMKTEDVWFLLDVEIGEVGDPRRDVFYITVGTPEALLRRGRPADEKRRGLLVISLQSARDIRLAVETLVQSCNSSSWIESVEKLRRYFYYEFDDYILETGPNQ